MAKKQKIDENIALIKKAIEEGKAIIGTDRTMKAVRNGEVSKVFISSNCPEEVIEALSEYSGISGTEVVQLDYPNDDFAVLCKKPYAISVISMKKE